MRLADSRTFCTAGSNRPIRIAMIAITTSTSRSVNADRWAAGPRGMRKAIYEQFEETVREIGVQNRAATDCSFICLRAQAQCRRKVTRSDESDRSGENAYGASS